MIVGRDLADPKRHAVPGDRPRRGRPTLGDDEILEIALELFYANGYESTSIDAICAAAGIAKRTIYLRFHNKHTLFRSALTRAIDEWILPTERLLAQECEDDEETLLNVGRTLVANVLSPAGLRLLRLTNAESVRMPGTSTFSVQRGTAPTLVYLADMFRRRFGLQDGNVPNAEEIAQAFLSLVVGGVSSNAAWGIDLTQAAIDRHTRNSVRLFLHELSLQRELGTLGDESRRLQLLLSEAAGMLEHASKDIREASAIIATSMCGRARHDEK